MGIQDQFKDKAQELADQAKQAARGAKPKQPPQRQRPQPGREEAARRAPRTGGPQSREQRRGRTQDGMQDEARFNQDREA
ncbi:hypothetical protein [Streptomyces sp. NPDC002889]|uniref:hypothetical protein n=1 Tax=Streptomyces sp. NPDC002889 TaxID=3364669 RepID=UPI0036B170E1